MAKPQKKGPKRTDHFAFFKGAAGEILGQLLSRYRLKQVSISEHMPECALKYHNETTGLTVTYEWKAAIWIELSRLDQTADGPLETERYGMDLLVAERCPHKSLSEEFHSIEWNDQAIERILRAYSGLLEEYARDILLGDFRVFPRLQKRTQLREAEELKRM